MDQTSERRETPRPALAVLPRGEDEAGGGAEAAGPRSDSRPVALTVQLPGPVYQAVRLAAQASGASQNQVIAELLSTALGEMTSPVPSSVKPPP